MFLTLTKTFHQIARKDFRPNTYASLLTSFNSAVVAYCESMGVRVRQVHNQENLIEKCGDWYVLGANAGGMCHPYQMYEDDPDKVKEQMAQLEAGFPRKFFLLQDLQRFLKAFRKNVKPNNYSHCFSGFGI